ncbi:glycine zipper 2TM domain-containing protein [Thiohalobacter sp.]|uniref:glycine zipper 2TM domain-containing protein n=1 Tax=Thiohalobacter sp. TaxID=2025948 RepID=UPI00262DEE31|nr:glycine zipper 2TM domain-containing protein [Thiohalobacter sp.]
MNRNSVRALTLAACLGALPGPAPADPGERAVFYDEARVVRVEPLVRVVRVAEPRETCREARVPVHEAGYRSATPMILGGILGGVIGNQMGKGHGKDVATVAGVILGGSIGRDIERDRRTDRVVGEEVVARCTTETAWREEERIEGYRVTYRYRGELFTTRMDHDPGSRLRMRVVAEPAAD